MASAYKGVVISPSLTKTAGGQDLYVPLIPSSGGGDIIPGNLQVGGNLAVAGTTSLSGAVSTGALTPASVTTAGAVSTGALTSASVTTPGVVTCLGATVTGGLTVSTGPSLFAGDVTMQTPGATATLTNASIGTLLNGSFNQSAGASIVAPSAQYTMRFGAWRFTWGLSQAANGSGDTGAIVFGTPFAGVPCVFCTPSSGGANGFFSPTNVTATQIGNLHGQTTGGTGFSVSAFWLAIGQA
jgi:hypothetical protein